MDKCSRVVCNNQSKRYIYVMKDECNQYMDYTFQM